MSGMPTTTIFNTIINGAIMYVSWAFYLCSVLLGVSTDSADIATIVDSDPDVIAHWLRLAEDVGLMDAAPLDTVVRGDDMLAFVPSELPEVHQYIARLLGFTPKATADVPLNQARFCSNAFWPTSEPGLYVPGPTFKCLLKYNIFCTPSALSDGKMRQYVRGKALGLLPACNHIPILSTMVQRALQQTQGVRGAGVAKSFKQQRVKLIDPVAVQPPDRASAFAYAADSLRLPVSVLQYVDTDIRTEKWNVCFGGAMHKCFVDAVYHTEIA